MKNKNKAGSIRTINDLDEDELYSKRLQFIDENRNLLRLYFRSLEIQMLKHTFFSRLFCKINKINLEQNLLINSTYRFSQREITVPKTINMACRLLAENEMSAPGIFRVNSVHENVDSLINLFEAIAEDKMNFKLGFKMISHVFDIIDISESYKRLFRRFGNPVFPNSFLRMISQINDSLSKEHRIICSKAIIYGLPTENRMILEHCIFLCTLMANKLESSDSTQHLNIVSLGVVMTPNLIDFSNKDFEFDFVKRLSSFISFLFEHFKEIIEVS